MSMQSRGSHDRHRFQPTARLSHPAADTGPLFSRLLLGDGLGRDRGGGG